MAKLASRESLVAGTVYYTCLTENSARTMGEISALSGIPLKKINRIYQIISKDPNITQQPSQSKGTSPAGYVQLLPTDLIGRMASQLKFPQNLISVARETCQRIVSCDLMNGHSPQVVAAGVLALLCVATKQKWRIIDLIKVSFTSEQSIKKIYHQLQQDCLSIMPREFINSIGGVSDLPLHLPDTS